MKGLSILGVVLGVTFGRVVYLYLDARAAYMRRARPSNALKTPSEANSENVHNVNPARDSVMARSSIPLDLPVP
jgi:hypothetical protein